MNDVYCKCVDCRKEFTKEEVESTDCCPNCGSTGIPLAPENDVEIKINWLELRILSVWAERWALVNNNKYPNMMKTLFAIVKDLQDQYPNSAPLTLAGELKEIQNAGFDVTSSVPFSNDVPLPEKVRWN